MKFFKLDFLVALIALILGVMTLLLIPFQVLDASLSAIKDVNSPAFFPILSAILIIVCSILLISSNLILARPSSDNNEIKPLTDRPWRQIFIMVIFIIYTLAINFVGMITASFLLIVGLSSFLGYRKTTIILTVAVVVPAMIYLLFEKTLHIMLPHGVLF